MPVLRGNVLAIILTAMNRMVVQRMWCYQKNYQVTSYSKLWETLRLYLKLSRLHYFQALIHKIEIYESPLAL